MEFWKTTINNTLLGSSKKSPVVSDLPGDLAEIFESINATETDPEEKFLQLASVTYNYRKSGTSPLKKEDLSIKTSPEEEKSYCNQEAIQSLKDIIHSENQSLLKTWLQYCDGSQKIINPELIPYLFSIAEKNKNLQLAIKTCCGKRGEWLSQFNPAWNFSSTASEEELWQTGTPEQRRNVLGEMRKNNPAKGREWLQQSWEQENANTKADLLKILHINISKEDESWLETLLNEKSQKVKDETWNLLKHIPESSIVSLYHELLKQSLSYKKEKALLGLVSKNKFDIKLPSSIDEKIFKSGIDKLSSNKEISDDEFIIYQLLQYTPLSNLEKIFESTPEAIIEQLNKDTTGKKLLPAIASAIGRFKNKEWAKAYSKTIDLPYREIASQLDWQEQNQYLIKHFANTPEESIAFASTLSQEWSVELTSTIFQHTSKNPYQFNRLFYGQNIHLIPVKAKNELFKISTEENLKGHWENIRDHLQHLLILKEQTIQSFNK